MAADASIYNLANQPTVALLNPLEIQARKIAIRNALAGGQMQGLDIQQKQQAIADEAATRNALTRYYGGAGAGVDPSAGAPAPAAVTPAAAPGAGSGLPFDPATGLAADPTGGAAAPPSSPGPAAPPAAAPAPVVPAAPRVPTIADLIRRGVPPAQASGLIQQFQKVDETSATIQKTRAEAVKANKEANDLVTQQGAQMADGIIKATPPGQPINADLLNWHLQSFASLGEAETAKAAQIRAQLARMDPDGQRQLLASIANTPKQLEANGKATEATTAATRLGLETPGLTTNQQGLTPQQQTEANLRAAEIAKLNTPAELALIASKPGPEQAPAKAALELLKQQNIEERKASAQAPVVITPGGYNLLGQQFQTTGQIPTIPRGPGAQVAANVINQTAENQPGFNPGVAKADYKANVGSLDSMQKQRDAVVTFEKTAGANLDQFLKLAAKLPDIKVPILNGKIRMLNDKVLGNEWAPAIQAGRQIAVNEIAKVTSNPTLSGALSDSARHEVSEYNPADATLAQTLHVAQVLRQDMQNRRKFFDEGIAEIKGRIAGGSSRPPASPADLQHKSTDELFDMLTKGK